MKLETARNYAGKIVDWLKPHCERVEIAGSVRRGCAICHDVDVVCVPRIRKGLNGLRLFLCEYVHNSGGKAHWRDPTFGPGCYGHGPYRDSEMLLFLPKCRLDVFSTTEENFIGCLMRATGSAKHVFELEKSAIHAKNFFSPENELFIQGKVVRLRTEREFYAAMGMEWLEPGKRV